MNTYDHDTDLDTDAPDESVTGPPQSYFDALLGGGFSW